MAMNRNRNTDARTDGRHWLRWGMLAAVLLLLLACFWFWHIHEKHTRQQEAQNRPPSVMIVKPKPAPRETIITLPGTIDAIQETPIYARTNGYLSHWYHDIGDYVEKGTLLADIDTPDIDQQLIQTKGTLRQAEANLDLARVTAERWKILLKENAVARQDADEKEANYKALLATVESARADVGRLAYLQSFKKLYAPFNGVVTERTVDNGALINSGSSGSRELFKVAEIDIMKTYIGVPQSEERAIKPGIAVQILLKEFPDRKFTGIVARSSREIDPVARTLLTEIDIPNPKGELLPGMYAQAMFHFPTPGKSLIVPASVLVIHTEEPKIILVDDDNKLHFATVVIGRDFGQQTEILDGITADARMVTNPNDALVENEQVRIEVKKAETPKAPKEDSEKDKKEKDKKNNNSGKKDKNKDEGEAPKKSSDNDTGGANANSNSEDAIKDSEDKLPPSYKKKPDQGGKKDGDKKSGDAGDGKGSSDTNKGSNATDGKDNDADKKNSDPDKKDGDTDKKDNDEKGGSS